MIAYRGASAAKTAAALYAAFLDETIPVCDEVLRGVQ
jgi:hypothetical protein